MHQYNKLCSENEKVNERTRIVQTKRGERDTIVFETVPFASRGTTLSPDESESTAACKFCKCLVQMWLNCKTVTNS